MTSTEEKIGGLLVGALVLGGALKLFKIDLNKLIAEATNGVRVEIEKPVPPQQEERAIDKELEDILDKAKEALKDIPEATEGEDILDPQLPDVRVEAPIGTDEPVESLVPVLIQTTGTTIRTGTVFGVEDVLIEQQTAFTTQEGASAFLRERFAALGQSNNDTLSGNPSEYEL